MHLLPLMLARFSGLDSSGPPVASSHLGPPAPGAAMAVGADSGWLEAVNARLRAGARAIRPGMGASAASVPRPGLDARPGAEGGTITGGAGEALSLRTVAWGREGSPMPAVAREPAWGACTSDLDASGGCIRRLEYADSDLMEWWIGLGTGLKQGWTVAVAPSGEGPLLFDVAIGGALSVEGGGEEVDVVDAEGRAWTVGGVHAFGADGRPAPARVVATGARLRLEVNDAHAVYPLEIDPVYSTASWTVVGEPEEEHLGGLVAGAGDVNGDGYDADADEDGYTDRSVSMASCGRPDGYALATQGDGDDADPAIHPGTVEVPADGIDPDGDGADDPDASGSGTKGHGCQSAGHEASIGVLALGLLLASRRRRASRGPARYVAAPVVRVPAGPRGGERGRGPRGRHSLGPW